MLGLSIAANDPLLIGTFFDDTIIGGSSSQLIFGDEEESLLLAAGILIGAGDTIDGGGGDDTIYGQGGGDSLDGGDDNDQLFGGIGDDLLDPGTAASGGSDLVVGGDGIDTLVLQGQPADYSFSVSGASFFVTSAAGVNVEVDGVERVAFGVTTQELVAGATPLTVAEFGSLFPNSSNSGSGMPPIALSDAIGAAPGATRVLIDLRDILANDYDPDGGVQNLVGFNTITPAGVSAAALLNATDIAAAGLDASLYPVGLLVVDISSGLSSPIKLQYRTVLEDTASGTSDISSQATITINPVAAVDDRILGSFGAETFIPYARLLANDGPGAVFGGIFNAYTLNGTIVDDPSRGGIVITSTQFNRNNAFFEYSLAGRPGIASVEVDLSNSPPITTPIARVVTPGSSFFLSFDEIRNKPGNFDPDDTGQPPLVGVSGAPSQGVSYSVGATGIDFTFASNYSGGFSLEYTLTDQPLLARSLPSTISYLTATPPVPVAGNEVLNWGINSDGRTLFQGGVPGFGTLYARELLANDAVMPGTVVGTSIDDTTPLVENLAIKGITYGIPGANGVTSRSDTGFGFEFKDNFTGSETYRYTIYDPLGRSATGLITLNVNIPQPVVRNDVIFVTPGATSVTVSAAEILGNDTYFGTGAIAEINANAVITVADSGVDIGGAKTRIDSFTFALDPGRALDTYQFNIRTFDTAAAGGSANGYQSVTFALAGTPPEVGIFAPTLAQEGTAPGAGGVLKFLVGRLGDSSGSSTVTYTLAAGPGGPVAPASADDIVGGFGPRDVTFAPGETLKEVEITVAPDALLEPNESVIATVTGVTNGFVGADSSVELIILDDEVPPPVVELALGLIYELEALPPQTFFNPPGNLWLQFQRTGDLSEATTLFWRLGPFAVDIPLFGGRAAQSEDIVGGFGDFNTTFAPGEDRAQIVVNYVDDTLIEPNEGFFFELTGATNGTIGETIRRLLFVSITDNDPTTFRLIAGTDAAEGTAPGSGGVLSFRVAREGHLSEQTLTYTIGGTGQSGSATTDDVIGGFGTRTVTFASGEVEKVIEVAVAADAAVEADEGIAIALLSAAPTLFEGGLGRPAPVIGTPSGRTLTILNDDVPPQPPVAVNDAYTFVEDDAWQAFRVLPVTSNDRSPNGRPLTLTAATVPAGVPATASVVGNDIWFFVSQIDWTTSLDIAYTITDGVDSASAVATISFTPVNDAPVGVADAVQTAFNTPVTFNIIANDRDAENDQLVAGGYVLPANGTLSLNNELVTYTPNAGFFGRDTFTYRPFDGQLQGDPTTVVVDVAPRSNRSPIAVDDSFTILADTVWTIPVDALLSNDTDPDGDPLDIVGYGLIGPPGLSFGSGFVDLPSGGVGFSPAPGFVGVVRFGYSVSDGTGGLDAYDDATVTLTVVSAPRADLRLEMAAQNLAPAQNSESAITLQVANGGPDAATSTVRLNLPSGVTLVAPAPPGFDVATGLWTTGSIAAGGSASINLALRFATPGGAPVTAEILTASLPDPDSTPGNGLPEDDQDRLPFVVTSVNAAPTDIALSNGSVLENLPVGTLVALLSATDPDAADTLTFSFAPNGNPGGLFRLDGNRLLTTASLDFEAAATRSITLRVTDSAGNSFDKPFTIAVNDLAEGGAVQPAVINAPGFSISQRTAGNPPGSIPGGPALPTTSLGAVQTSPITLPGESDPRARIENTGVWNGLKTLTLDADYWNPSLGSNLLVANFVDVRWDLSTAPPLDFDLQVVGAKRGAIDFGGGDDTLTWLFHSDGSARSNTATVSGGEGNDVLRFAVVGSSGVDDALLADNPGTGNGSQWNASYDGRFSTAIASGGEGDDRIEAQGRVRLEADGGEGRDTLTGSVRDDSLVGGLGEDLLIGGGDGGSFRFSGRGSARRVVVSGGDVIDLRAPGGGGDGAADTAVYDVAGGGVDRIFGFEAGRDRLQVLGGVGTAQVAEVANGTFLSFTGRPLQGVLIEGVRGLSLGGAGDIQLLA